MKVDQAGRPLPPKPLGILVGLTLILDSLCTIVNVVENIWTFWFVFRIFCVASLERFVLAGLAEMRRFSRKCGRNSSKYRGWSLVSDEVCLDKTCVISRKEMPKSP